jgi:hypothetical protein
LIGMSLLRSSLAHPTGGVYSESIDSDNAGSCDATLLVESGNSPGLRPKCIEPKMATVDKREMEKSIIDVISVMSTMFEEFEAKSKPVEFGLLSASKFKMV